MTRRWDCLVLGAGPAGALAAFGLASRGLSVLIADKARFPRAKVCGCCLNHRALSALGRSGLSGFVDRLPGRPLSGIQIAAGGRDTVLDLPGGWAVSRDHLDAALLDAAREAGAVFCPETTGRLGEAVEGARAVELQTAGGRRTEFARVVLVATGLGGMRGRAGGDSRFGAGTVLEGAPDFYRSGRIYMACAEDGYAGVVRIEGEQVNVAAALNFARFSGAGLKVGARIRQIIEGAGWPVPSGLESAAWKGTPLLTRRPPSLAGERYFVLGDAAGYSEPFTGEGMGWAFDSALFLSGLVPSALNNWNNRYARMWESWYKNKILPYRNFSLWLSRSIRHRWIRKAGSWGLTRLPHLVRPWAARICEG